jgi:hypothetical protein
MKHEEYVSRLDQFTDEDAATVLAHAESCVECRRERRRMDGELARLDARRGSVAEEVARWAAVAAFLVIAVYGLRPPPAAVPVPPKSAARYRVVGNSSGVVAYTPAGIVVGAAAKPATREVVP